ncbi:potassium-transporting ATPase subunit KdpC [Aeromicrobium wangtongii]|uniref:Potassium-transporting ATPase KdpC subunit n=1 Tax=Aeromicrobium wangtongii TaxID=2969247 RepID=A0ABY5M6X0_9ACTN|nr:potassium-transporting ATPase subunit KdpC [Aeromicrobium wangtongii]MCD9199098.1 potassium-transporting ATPase subunit KdpC [Aeromicrobium wangtongii]UUP12871.1 potassium-transporting ATPase subunit KdpC [Aeromicrobium wangtongii]
MLKDFGRQSLAGLRILLVFTVILGVAYPAAVWGVGRTVHHQTDGQPITTDGRVVGSAIIGQNFTGEEWFHSRPSPNDYDTLASAPSNLGPSNTDLLALIEERRAEVARTESVDPSDVPPDAVTASGSGLDPHISVAYARIQVERVAKANGLGVAAVRQMVANNTDGRSLGFLGEPGVNVLRLNVDVKDAATQTAG